MTKTCATLLFALGASACTGASNPEGLAKGLQDALAQGNADAVLASADLRGAPAMAVFMLADLPNDCDEGATCTVSLKPLDAEWKSDNEKQMAAEGAEWGAMPEGLLAVSTRDAGEGGGSSELSLPYGKVDGQYRIVIGRYTSAKLAELKATTPQAAALKTLAGGIYDDAIGERDTSWATTAEVLPADGGEAGAAFQAKLKAMAAAIKAGDPDAAAIAGGEWGKVVLGATSYDGKPVPLEARKRKLRSQGTRMLVEAQVLGGWRKGDTAVLVIEGTNGVGNTVRGAQLMDFEGGTWSDAGRDVIEFPPQG
jgi:hypothetical protein